MGRVHKVTMAMGREYASVHVLPLHGAAATVPSEEARAWSERMDAIREFLTTVRQANLIQGHLRGLLHILIGRKITRSDGTLVSQGLTWRETAAWLRQLRWDPQWARELNVDAATMNIRDRDRFWYAVIAQARLDSPEAIAEADKLAALLQPHGYVVGPPPSALATKTTRPSSPPSSPSGSTTPSQPDTPATSASRKRKKKDQ